MLEPENSFSQGANPITPNKDKNSYEQVLQDNKALKKQLAEISKENKSLKEFAHVICHELRQPLSTISNFIQLLRKRYSEELDETANMFIETSLHGVDLLSQTLKSVLEYSQVNTKKMEFEEVNLNHLMDVVIKNLDGLEDTEIIYNNLPVIKTNYIQMTQVFLNLIGNAYKYRRKEKLQIHISAQLKENEWLFSVRDNGIGIHKTHFNDIFTIFNRVETGEMQPGEGIGLSICKKIIEGYNGKIWVESIENEGSVFLFTIPFTN